MVPHCCSFQQRGWGVESTPKIVWAHAKVQSIDRGSQCSRNLPCSLLTFIMLASEAGGALNSIALETTDAPVVSQLPL
jgi:hypothetical protein